MESMTKSSRSGGAWDKAGGIGRDNPRPSRSRKAGGFGSRRDRPHARGVVPIRFVICGDGPEFGPLVEETQRRDLDGWVHFLKHVPGPGRLLLECDAVLNPSDSEGGMPLAAGRSITGGDTGGCNQGWGSRGPPSRSKGRSPRPQGRRGGALRDAVRRARRAAPTKGASFPRQRPVRPRENRSGALVADSGACWLKLWCNTRQAGRRFRDCAATT